GSGNKWRRIYNANKDKIQDPNLIYPGQELVIPPGT
ncbi:MAG: Peptidoglycan-binding lysin domain-containing protein, partial [Parcubacteria group bacterium GW2011_GWA2_42_11]